jgi:hypothetical protein
MYHRNMQYEFVSIDHLLIMIDVFIVHDIPWQTLHMFNAFQ